VSRERLVARRIGIGSLLIALLLVLVAVVTGNVDELWDPSNLWLLATGFLIGIATNRRLW
jgi:hypothetical protein